MKNLFFLFMIPGFAYALCPNQFTEFTKKNFERKFQNMHSRLEEKGIDTKTGIAAVYTQWENIDFEKATKNENAMKIANEFYASIKEDPQYTEVVDHIKNAKTEEAFENASYEYMKFIYTKSAQAACQHCIGLNGPEENRNLPNERQWMMIDYPEFFELNKDKQFNEDCMTSILGINLVTSIAMQDLYEIISQLEE